MAGLWESTRNLVTGRGRDQPGVSSRSVRSASEMRDSGGIRKDSIDESGEYYDTGSIGGSFGRNGPTFSKRVMEAMLRERDETIASLEKARLVEVQMLAEVRASLDGLRKEYRQELYWRDFEISHLKKERAELLERLAAFQRDLRNEDLVRDIANLIMEAAPKSEDNTGGFDDEMSISGVSAMTTADNYTSKLQSKLCKAMHKMNIMSNQMKKIQASCDEVVKSLQVEINEVVEDKCKMEVELLNRLDMLDHEKRVSEEQLGAKLDYKERKIEELEGNLADLREVAMGDENLEEERRELEAARDEVRRLKKSNRAKQRKIEQMQEIGSIERGESKICGSSVFSNISEDTSFHGSDGEDDVSRLSNADIGPHESGNIISIVTRIAKVTSHMEKDVRASLVKREEVLNSLKDAKMSLADAAKDDEFARGQILMISTSASGEESMLIEHLDRDEDRLRQDCGTSDRRRQRRGATEEVQLVRRGSAKY